jgi:hypothetical protein
MRDADAAKPSSPSCAVALRAHPVFRETAEHCAGPSQHDFCHTTLARRRNHLAEGSEVQQGAESVDGSVDM